MSRTAGFEKFINKKKSGAVKEKFKQEKRIAKKERAAAIDKFYEEKRKRKAEMEAVRNAAKTALTTKGTDKTGRKPTDTKANTTSNTKGAEVKTTPATSGMPLNKYIAHGGVCSRRDAATLVKDGKVQVNGKIITEPGFKISEQDIVKVNGKKIVPTKNLVYILLNKPKDYITTTDDPQGRKTVLQLIRQATDERVYPVGRLDRNTSGVLLLTNDGDLAQTLSHPKHEIKKIYEVTLDKPLTKADFEAIAHGLVLEDGFIQPDAIGYVDSKDKSIIGIEIHSGRNRIVRRIFEHLKYDVRGLDRVMYAGLTKKNVNRGKWRMLSEREVRILKHFNKTKKAGVKQSGTTAKQSNAK